MVEKKGKMSSDNSLGPKIKQLSFPYKEEKKGEKCQILGPENMLFVA